MADDYMSDAILAQVPDIRPGLYKKRKIEDRKKPAPGKGKAKPFNKKEHVQKKVQLNAKEKLVEGLKTPCLAEDNPGMKMMRMMGYNPGTGLGKEGEGRAEPIVVDPFKEKKAGLGKETEELERANKRARYELERLQAYKRNEVQILQTYRTNMRETESNRHIARDTRKSQSVCAQLDGKLGLTPPEPWFHPPPRKKRVIVDDDCPVEEEEDIPEQPEPGEILPLLTVYLKHTHLYCVWCGMSYRNAEDMRSSCPGDDYQAHEDDGLDFAD